MRQCTRKHLQQITVLIFIFKMRRQATKSTKKFLRSCVAKVARSANMKCSGTRLEVSGSRLSERGGVGKGRKGVWGRDTATYISMCLFILQALGNIFLHLSNFGFFGPN